ncbi:hypothetical protein EV363DRAFT_1427620 [Boletus edulis]|nr:hypothetical protein EV363DRAFT_1427620 [Boletus edulis]
MTSPAFATPLELPLSQETLAAINDHLRPLDPPQILEWAVKHLPSLYQTTAFGLTGIVAIDMLSKIAPNTANQPPLIFVDTLYHFPETYALVEEVEKRYGLKVTVYKPAGCETVADFEKKWGERFWERDEDTSSPDSVLIRTFNVCSVITGRRASQGADRASLQPLEVDATGLLKLNPLFAWKFSQVEEYEKTECGLHKDYFAMKAKAKATQEATA